jgi:HicA toxin of bacterial toxin-antitoxin,
MNARHARTLAAIFKEPTPANVEWAAIEALLIAAGCKHVEGSGSRVRFVKDDMIETFHRPHPAKEAKRYQVRAARDYLIRLGVKP